MTEFDSLENELGAMQPRQPSAELKSRIAERLAASTHGSFRSLPDYRNRTRIAIVGGLAAACLAAIAIWRERAPRMESNPRDVPHALQAATAFDPDVPSVWSYRVALGRSRESVDALLDRHAAEERASSTGHLHVHAFARLDSNFNDLMGEL